MFAAKLKIHKGSTIERMQTGGVVTSRTHFTFPHIGHVVFLTDLDKAVYHARSHMHVCVPWELRMCVHYTSVWLVFSAAKSFVPADCQREWKLGVEGGNNIEKIHAKREMRAGIWGSFKQEHSWRLVGTLSWSRLSWWQVRRSHQNVSWALLPDSEIKHKNRFSLQ